MKKFLSPRVGVIGALCLAFAVTACETPAPEGPPPPPPFNQPAPALNASVAQDAAVYLAYMTDVSTLASSFSDGGQVRAEMIRAGAWEPQQLSRGIVAYSAIVALQSPEYVNGVRSLATTAEARDLLIRRILADPAYAAQLPGAQHAAGLIALHVGGQGQLAYEAGAAIKQSAYDIQRQRWSSQHVTDRESRLESFRVQGETPVAYNVDLAASLQQAGQSGAGLGLRPAESAPPYTPTVARALSLAALAALGSAGEDARNLTDALLVEPVTADCLRFNKLMMAQCLAASRPHYEEMFCLGQHMMMDLSQCVIDSAGSVISYNTVTDPTTVPTPPAPAAEATQGPGRR